MAAPESQEPPQGCDCACFVLIFKWSVTICNSGIFHILFNRCSKLLKWGEPMSIFRYPNGMGVALRRNSNIDNNGNCGIICRRVSGLDHAADRSLSPASQGGAGAGGNGQLRTCPRAVREHRRDLGATREASTHRRSNSKRTCRSSAARRSGLDANLLPHAA